MREDDRVAVAALEVRRGRHERGTAAQRGHRRTTGQRFVVPLDQLGFVIPGLKLAHRTGAEDDDDVLCLGPEMWRTRRIRTGGVDDRTVRRQQTIETEQARHEKRMETLKAEPAK